MAKAFYDVFPTLELSDFLQSLMEYVQVERVTLNPDRDFMRIYLLSEKLIHKKYIYEIEQAIKDQLFSDVLMTVKIIEKFQLSRQYTPRKLMPVYEDSIAQELKNYNALLYSLFQDAQKEFKDENTLHLVIPDSVVADGKEHELLEILEKIFCERCSMDFHVSAERTEPKKNKKREIQERELEQEVAAIRRIYESVKAEEDRQKAEGSDGGQAAGTGSQSQKKDKDASAGDQKSAAGDKNAGGRQGGFKDGKKTDFHKSGDRLKRSDNPDVIYGRDFDGEPITIESITGEIGGVMIRGQVLSVELRELRIEKTLVIFNITDFTDSIGVKLFVKNEQAAELSKDIKKGAFLMLNGVTTIDRFDSQLTIGNIMGIKKIADFREKRVDTSAEKRVELHCHT